MKKYIYIIMMLQTITATVGAQDSLQTYIMVATHHNPQVMAAYNAYRAQLVAVGGEGVLNDPELSVAFFPKSMEQVNVKQVATFSVMQMFPWFGTLKAGRRQMEWKAEAAYQLYRQTGIELAFEVQKRWYDMLATQEKIRFVKQRRMLLKDIKEVSLYQYKSPTMAKGAKMSDLLRLESEDARLEERIASQESVLELQKQQFNLLLHREPASPIVLPDTIVEREMPMVTWSDMERNHPQLAQLTAEGQAYSAQQEKAIRMGMPMFGVGVEYMLNSKVEMPRMADMNGMDMLMPMVKMTLPIYRKKTHAARKSAELLKQSAADRYKRQQDVLRSRLLAIKQRAADEKRKLALYEKELEILQKTIVLMQAEYATGTTSLTDILQATREQIDYWLSKAEAMARYNTLVAECDQLASKYDYTEREVRHDK